MTADKKGNYKPKCGWCGAFLDHIFQGDEVILDGNAYFVCSICGELMKSLEFRRFKEKEE